MPEQVEIQKKTPFKLRGVVPVREGKPLELEEFLKGGVRAQFVPEYEYKHFFFLLDYWRAFWPLPRHDKFLPEQAQIADKILSISPQTQVTFVTSADLKQTANDIKGLGGPLSQNLDSLAKSGRVRMLRRENLNEMWAQDIGEPTGGEGSKYVSGYVSPRYEIWRKKERPGLVPLDRLEVKAEQIHIPVVLQGGNFTKAVSKDGRRLAIVGSDDVLDTQRLYRQKYRYAISVAEIKEVYRQAFGADEVVVLGEGTGQPGKAFHIDQAVFFPARGLAVMMKPEKEAPDRAHLREQKTREKMVRDEVEPMLNGYREQLEAAGFEVIEIPTTAERIDNSQSYTNSVVVQGTDGTHLIMPSFLKNNSSEAEEESQTQLQALEERIQLILEARGFKVDWIKNSTWELQGNTHCITGAISYLGMEPPKNSTG